MIAIIPARGGSKGLPGKNIKELAGKPLIGYSIEAALECPDIQRVVVTTDSPAIAEISRVYGAEVPFMRPPELATDKSSAIDVYLHAIGLLEKQTGQRPEAITVLLPTAPLRTAADISAAIHLFHRKKADAVLSFTKEHHPVAWHRRLFSDYRIGDPVEPQRILNRQEASLTYYPNGAIFVLKSTLLELGTYYTDASYAYVMPRCRSVDIDTAEDFEYAAFLLNKSKTI